MTWIDDRITGQKRLQECKRIISANAEVVFSALWEEVSRWVDEARQKGFPIFTNGGVYEREIRLAENPRQDAQRLRICLEKEKAKITVRGALSLEFSIEVSDDNVVHLTHNHKPISIAQASIAILDPFLFPELQKPQS